MVKAMKHLILCCIILSAFGSHESRRRLAPDASIIKELKQQLNDGISHPRFSITALFSEGSSLTEYHTELFEIDVVMTNPSVSESTTFSVEGFNRPVESPIKLLVADDANPQSDDFAILAVNEKDGSVSGLVRQNNKFVKLEQSRDEQTRASQIIFDPDEDWECMFDIDSDHDHDHVHEAGHNGHAFQLMSSKLHNRNNLRQLFNVVDDVKLDNRELYATDTFPNAWSYQVDLFIEVDDAFVQNHDTDTVNMPNTINYVNALVSAVSVIYEREVDTHRELLDSLET